MSDTKKRILVAEDDPSISSMLERILRKDYDVVIAANGAEALSMALRSPPNLLLLDVMMPGVDGLQVARQVRAHPALKRVPIIFLTAKDGAMDVVKGIQHGARHYITKPFKLDDVLEKVKKAIA